MHEIEEWESDIYIERNTYKMDDLRPRDHLKLVAFESRTFRYANSLCHVEVNATFARTQWLKIRWVGFKIEKLWC